MYACKLKKNVWKSLNFKSLYNVAFVIVLAGFIAIIADFGFSQNAFFQKILDSFYFVVLGVGIVSTIARYSQSAKKVKTPAFVFDLLSIGFTLWLYYLYVFVGESFETDLILSNPLWVKIAVLLAFIRESSEIKINFKQAVLNPAQLFIISFLVIILIGSLLLMLPNATHHGIPYVDALFTSTSAVCVTGLVVVDTGAAYTVFGQTIIMILIQLGGIGILTFASYFSYFFKGGTTYKNQLAISDLTSARKLGEVFSTLKYIILITVGIELVAGILIYTSLDSSYFYSQSEEIFFSAFHAISAFCNAGFSTLSNSLYQTEFRFNYYLQLIIVFTFILGGLGFPIVVNILKYLKYKGAQLLFPKKSKYRPWILNLNSRITLITTLSITAVAFIIFYLVEYNNTLAEHSGFGKIITALFGAATPRTAGFNSIDTAALSLPIIFMVVVLMWIGASPQSTGGGIKTSTFAVAILNILALARGKSNIEVFRREIAEVSVRRAFAIISLSLFVISLAVILVSIFDPEKKLLEVVFECVSAYSTSGLSLGITGDLSDMSKIVIIMVMFIGRVSMLSLVIAVFKKVKYKSYAFPKEEISMN